jgi:hypothetical protein
LNFEKSIPENISTSEHFAKLLMKEREMQNDTIFQQVRDSIYSKYVNDEARENLESLQIEPDLIRVIGLLEMKECIPVLKKNLQECIQNECSGEWRKAYRYALARLGDKEQRQYILDNLMGADYFDDDHFDRRSFAYFRDDEMIWRYIEANYFSDKQIGILSDVYIPASLKTMYDVYPYIKNLPQRLAHSVQINSNEEENQWAKSLYEWLMVNKDTVEFDYEAEEVFPW